MSASAVRASARSMVQDAGWPAALPFYETVNTGIDRQAVNDLPSWSSLRFDLTQPREAIDVGGSCFMERGVVSVMLMVRAGSGDSAVTGAWATIDSHIRGWTWPAGFSGTPSAPEEVTEDPDGRWQRWDVAVEYIYQET